MKTYTFKVVVEPDDGRWHAFCPALKRYGATTWGETEDESVPPHSRGGANGR